MITKEFLESFPAVCMPEVRQGDYFIIHYMPDWCWTKQGLAAARVRRVSGPEAHYENIGMGIEAVLDEGKKLDIHRLYYAGLENRLTYKMLVGLPPDVTPLLTHEIVRNFCAIHVPKNQEDTLHSLSSDPYYIKSLKFLKVSQEAAIKDSNKHAEVGRSISV
jgi:hypothetical protein